ncbi:uncharacterized protein LOC143205880 isoform X2 [Rhynchophorus ferrugineus]|uniref:uncharacterized protein LOC143205880 isoform X2 n=1 Tax=Rhynchophorus ferrugineus TaxID=354439 RepID=UPI003FCE0CB1
MYSLVCIKCEIGKDGDRCLDQLILNVFIFFVIGFKIWKNGEGMFAAKSITISFSTTSDNYQHMPKLNDNKNRSENYSSCVGSSQVINEENFTAFIYSGGFFIWF